MNKTHTVSLRRAIAWLSLLGALAVALGMVGHNFTPPSVSASTNAVTQAGMPVMLPCQCGQAPGGEGVETYNLKVHVSPRDVAGTETLMWHYPANPSVGAYLAGDVYVTYGLGGNSTGACMNPNNLITYHFWLQPNGTIFPASPGANYSAATVFSSYAAANSSQAVGGKCALGADGTPGQPPALPSQPGCFSETTWNLGIKSKLSAGGNAAYYFKEAQFKGGNRWPWTNGPEYVKANTFDPAHCPSADGCAWAMNNELNIPQVYHYNDFTRTGIGPCQSLLDTCYTLPFDKVPGSCATPTPCPEECPNGGTFELVSRFLPQTTDTPVGPLMWAAVPGKSDVPATYTATYRDSCTGAVLTFDFSVFVNGTSGPAGPVRLKPGSSNRSATRTKVRCADTDSSGLPPITGQPCFAEALHTLQIDSVWTVGAVSYAFDGITATFAPQAAQLPPVYKYRADCQMDAVRIALNGPGLGTVPVSLLGEADSAVDGNGVRWYRRYRHTLQQPQQTITLTKASFGSDDCSGSASVCFDVQFLEHERRPLILDPDIKYEQDDAVLRCSPPFQLGDWTHLTSHDNVMFRSAAGSPNGWALTLTGHWGGTTSACTIDPVNGKCNTPSDAMFVSAPDAEDDTTCGAVGWFSEYFVHAWYRTFQGGVPLSQTDVGVDMAATDVNLDYQSARSDTTQIPPTTVCPPVTTITHCDTGPWSTAYGGPVPEDSFLHVWFYDQSVKVEDTCPVSAPDLSCNSTSMATNIEVKFIRDGQWQAPPGCDTTFATIQDAVDYVAGHADYGASPAGVVYLGPQTYNESVSITQHLVSGSWPPVESDNARIWLVGHGPASTIISSPAGPAVFVGATDGVGIVNLGVSGPVEGVEVSGSFRDGTFCHIRASGGTYGFNLDGTTSSVADDLASIGPSIDGLWLKGGDDNTFTNVLVENPGQRGLLLEEDQGFNGCNGNHLTNFVVTGAGENGGIIVGSNNTLQGSTFEASAASGLLLFRSNNQIVGNTFADNTYHGLFVSNEPVGGNSQANTIAENTFRCNGQPALKLDPGTTGNVESSSTVRHSPRASWVLDQGTGNTINTVLSAVLDCGAP
ncbi:MAG: right-handed parallel beta-helix repeat-containing protein [Ardenticatenales bacterium]